ncbi:MAG TPA: YbhB/YbcL family Raf kinase inhibitor-like protein [Patescibacteria group bacterium]
MKLTSSAFQDNQPIPVIYTCEGNNINPPLTITDVPPLAKSLALIVEDIDAPRGTFTHWIMWDIPANIHEIQQSTFPEGAVSGINDFGNFGYGGPCPPSGTHRYYFRLFALNDMLSLSPETPKKEVVSSIMAHLIEDYDLVGIYSHTLH